MLNETQMQALLPEIYTRLCLMDEEWEYEIAVPDRRDLLGLAGGAKESEFLATPIILSPDGSRTVLPPRRFIHRVQGTINVAGRPYPNIRVISADEPQIELWDWLISDPWYPAEVSAEG
jgi:hypothetical protein